MYLYNATRGTGDLRPAGSQASVTKRQPFVRGSIAKRAFRRGLIRFTCARPSNVGRARPQAQEWHLAGQEAPRHLLSRATSITCLFKARVPWPRSANGNLHFPASWRPNLTHGMDHHLRNLTMES